MPYCALYDTLQQLRLKSISLKRDQSEKKISSTNSKNLKFSHYKPRMGRHGQAAILHLCQPWRLTQNRKSIVNGNSLVVQRLALNAIGPGFDTW